LNRRLERANFTLRRELGALTRTVVSDPRLAPMTSITRVECASDLGSAKVYVTVLGDDAARAESVEALKSAAGLLRNRLQDRVRMRRVPRLVFLPDEALAGATEMLALIDSVSADDAERNPAPEEE